MTIIEENPVPEVTNDLDSLLTSVKKMLGIAEDYKHFDETIIMTINSTFMILMEIGVENGKIFSIFDENAKWSDYTKDTMLLNILIPYVYLRTRLLFDPPTTSFLLDSIKGIIKEYEWRISVHLSTNSWTFEEIINEQSGG